MQSEPQLKFQALNGDLDRILAGETISCLCLSDKILVLGTEEGRVHVLDYCGNQVRCLVLHKVRVTELSIDAAEEYVASCSEDGLIFVMGLCGDLSLEYKYGKPVKSLAIDPRFASRKTKEFVAINDAGVVQLSTQGWLGRSDYTIGDATGASSPLGKAQVVRWWKDLVAWATDTALTVYCTMQHRVVCTVRRPKGPTPVAQSKGSGTSGRPSLLFGQNSHVYVSWPDCVKVVRISYSLFGPALGPKAEQVCELKLPDHLMALGVSPFGRELALLTAPSPHAKQQPQPQQQQQQQQWADSPDNHGGPQLRIVSHQGRQLAVDALPMGLMPPPIPRTPPPPSSGPRQGPPPDPTPWYQLVPSLPSTTTEATTFFSWGRGLSALASLPAYAASAAANATTSAGSSMQGDGPEGQQGVAESGGADLQGVEEHRKQDVGGSHHTAGHAQQQQKEQQKEHEQREGGRGGEGAASPSSQHHQGDHHARHTRSHSKGGGEEVSADQHHQQQHQQQQQQQHHHHHHHHHSQHHHGWAHELLGPHGLMEGVESAPAEDAEAANELLTFFIVSPKMVCVAQPRDANDRVLWLIEVGRFSEALELAEAGLRAARGLTHGDMAKGLGVSPDGQLAYDVLERRGEDEEGPRVGPSSHGVTRETYEKVVQAYIGSLLSSGSFGLAASQSWRLLGRNAAAWERWVYLFAQARHLPLLAPYLPTENPRLRSGLYDIVLASLLMQTEHHKTALQMVRSWPSSLFNMPQLMELVASRMKRPGGESRELALIMAELYERQARPDLALATYLQLREPRALELLEAGAGPAGRGAAALLAPRASAAAPSSPATATAASGISGPAAVSALLALDEERALDALVRHAETLPPAHVVNALQEAELSCTDTGHDSKPGPESQRLRRALWRYLAAVMATDPTALAPEHAHLAIVLAAEYAPPGKLLDMLSGSGGAGAPLIPLESALAVCEEHNMVPEQVYLLGRMGNASRALHLIIEKLEDIPQAIEFVRGQRDDELWEQLMSWALGSPETTGALLDHIGGHLNPLSIIRRLPTGGTIPRLRDRVISIIADFRTQTSLHEGCNTILRADCAHLMAKFYAAARAHVPVVFVRCSSWAAFQCYQKQRSMLGTTSGSAAQAGASEVWLRYSTPTLFAPPSHTCTAPTLHPLAGPQELPQGLHTALQSSPKAPVPPLLSTAAEAIGQGLPSFGGSGLQRQQGPLLAWVGCLAPDAPAEDGTSSASSSRGQASGTSGGQRSSKRQQRQQAGHGYSTSRLPTTQNVAALPPLVHLS